MSSTQALAEVSAARRPVRGHRRWDFALIAAALILLATAAFVPSLVNSGRRHAPVTPLVAVHGILNAAWLLVFLAQAVLIATRHRAAHAWLGIASVGLALAMIVVGYKTAIAVTVRGFDLSGDLALNADPVLNLVFQLGDLVTFSVLLSAGLLFRRRAATHKRLMLLATVGMMAPSALTHLVDHNFGSRPAVFLPLLALVFLSPALYERLRLGHFQRVTLWGGILLFAWGNIRAVIIGPSDAWKHFAAWLIR